MTSTSIGLDWAAASRTEFADVPDSTLREALAKGAVRALNNSNLPWNECVANIRATILGEGQKQINQRPSLWTDRDETQYRLNAHIYCEPTFKHLPECFAGLEAARTKFCYVPSQHFDGAVRNNCYGNAFTAAEKQGGRVSFGYIIVEFKHHYNAEPHVVWEKVNGTLVDPTPHGIDKVAFIRLRTIAHRDRTGANRFWKCLHGGDSIFVWKKGEKGSY